VPLGPGRNLQGFVCRVVVQHRVDVQPGLDGLLNLFQKSEELLMAIDDFSGGHIQRRERLGGPVAVVVVGPALRSSGPRGQYRLAAIQGLDSALLVHTHHHRPGTLRGIHVQPDDVPQFFHEERICGEFEVLLQVGLQPERPPNPDDGILVEPAGLGHGPGAPVGGVIGASFQRPGDHLLHLLVGDLARLTRARCVRQSPRTTCQDPFPPLVHGLDRTKRFAATVVLLSPLAQSWTMRDRCRVR